MQQAGSLVAPDRLRFDFSHHEPVTAEQLTEIERLANAQIITDTPVRHFETTKAEAEQLGAIAFFGEKYGEIVRVLEAGPSTELCGGTHVHALGFIGPIKIVSEGSIGSNLRRIEAMTGDGALEYIEQEEQLLRRAGELLRAAPKEIPEKLERLVEQVRALQDELQTAEGQGSRRRPRPTSRASADQGVLVARHDGLGNDELRQLAVQTVQALGSGVVALAGHRRRQGGDRGRGEQGPRRRGARRPTRSRGRRRSRSAAASARVRTRSRAAAPNVDGIDDALAARTRPGGRVAAVTARRRPEARNVLALVAVFEGRGRSRMSRNPGVLGVDLGSVRIGLALSDPTRTVASPHSVLQRSRSHETDHQAIVATAREAEATAIVVGLPLSLSGREGPAAQAAARKSKHCVSSRGPTSRSSPTTSASRPSPPNARSARPA